jgi:hypothetical protein
LQEKVCFILQPVVSDNRIDGWTFCDGFKFTEPVQLNAAPGLFIYGILCAPHIFEIQQGGRCGAKPAVSCTLLTLSGIGATGQTNEKKTNDSPGSFHIFLF